MAESQRAELIVQGFGAKCGLCGFEYKAHNGHIYACPVCRLKSLAKIVSEMRKAQNTYFNTPTRNRLTLIEAKRLEAAVDLKLGEIGVK